MVAIISLELLLSKKRDELEKALQECKEVEEFEIEDLDNRDDRKSVIIGLVEPMEARDASRVLIGAIGYKPLGIGEE